MYHKTSRYTTYAIPDPALNAMPYKCILPLILDELFDDMAQFYGSLKQAYLTCTIELAKMKRSILVFPGHFIYKDQET